MILVIGMRWPSSQRREVWSANVSRKCLESDQGVKAVRNEEQKGLQLGIRGVPYFHRDGLTGLSGAKPPAVMAEWLRQKAGVQAPA